MRPDAVTKILAGWAELPDECKARLATDEDIAAFEAEWSPVPDDFKWFLQHCGGGPCGSDEIDGIDRLPWSHTKFRKESGPGGWTMQDVFVIGWDGWGNPFGIHRPSGEVRYEVRSSGDCDRWFRDRDQLFR